ncbi:AEC family transporter [Cognatishimia sp. F0-27]|uniref:AEC family transporter n=1 Tax=Cognatishimia sp. F0-27 TaxID=2816855 RepID=UPI001D0C2749|nr:AEC family transporter [Cognatishimia sp. F0-27]MCC1493585.1 AEC family transporter [Cognatishimia sp. F0-27]
MQALIDVILPVFAVIAAGYVAVWRGFFSDTAIDGIMEFTQKIAIPCLLFRAIWQVDFAEVFNPALLLSFYTGSATGFTVGLLGARYLFGRDWEDSVAIGFASLFANSVMLGLPLTERAYGTEALSGNYAIIAFHSPFCYMLGITAMEIVRARGGPKTALPGTVAKAMFRNALVIGIALGALSNWAEIQYPRVFADALDMVVAAALPTALFGMGGVLCRYKPEGDGRVIAMICAISLVLHPSIAWTLGQVTQLSDAALRSAVINAAMAPGINSYVFANMYGRAKRVNASAVLIATVLSIFTAWVWLTILP